MRKSFLWLILFACIGLYFYVQKRPCEEPIQYKIGTIDPRFGVSEAQFQNDIAQASGIWGHALNKTLFEYNPKAHLTVSLVYDTRQAITQKEQVLSANIDQNSQVADSVKEQYSTLQGDYKAAQSAYTQALAQFTEAQGTYNAEVTYWNTQGGAPKNEYDKLAAQKDALLAQRDSLEQKRQAANSLATQMNVFIDKYNLLVDHINSDVNTINNDGLAGTQFEEGVYISDNQGERIEIYQFKNQIDLIRVLAHELGHAMTLAHNNNPDSIMNPVNQGAALTLSSDDFQELKTACGIK